MYEHYGQKNLIELVSQLDGQFAFVLSDAKTGFYMAARDPIGIASLYYGFGQDGEMWFSSELKALKEQCVDFHQFPPGHVYDSVSKTFKPYFAPKWYVVFELFHPSLTLLHRVSLTTLTPYHSLILHTHSLIAMQLEHYARTQVRLQGSSHGPSCVLQDS